MGRAGSDTPLLGKAFLGGLSYPAFGPPAPTRPLVHVCGFSPAHHLCAACCDHLESGPHSTTDSAGFLMKFNTFCSTSQHTRMAACELSMFCCSVFCSTDPGESFLVLSLAARLDVICFQRSVSTTEFSGDSQTSDRKAGEPEGQGRRKPVLPTVGGPAWGSAAPRAA